jgi:ABC-2 family transporter protein
VRWPAALGVQQAFRVAGLTAAQVGQVSAATPLPVTGLQPASGGAGPGPGVSVIGLVLIFLMLNLDNTWTLIGVMEEKSSRVVEVLLAAIRPVQLLTGKVIGIGLVALTQAGVTLIFTLGLARAVGSDVLGGTAPAELVAILIWLLLGYAFYSWVCAAAGSLVERQDQVQTLSFPLAVPVVFGYIMALTTAGSGSPSTFFEVLAYLPPRRRSRCRCWSDWVWPLVAGHGLRTDQHHLHGRAGPAGRGHLPAGDPAHRQPGQAPRGTTRPRADVTALQARTYDMGSPSCRRRGQASVTASILVVR